MHPGIAWMIAGLVLLIVELLTTTFFLLWIGMGALVTALLSVWIGAGWAQWLIFAMVSLVLLAATRPMARRIHDRSVVPSNVDRLLGQVGVVLEAVDNHANTGRMRLGSEEWRARCDQRIPQEARARVVRVEGTTLWVEPVDAAEKTD